MKRLTFHRKNGSFGVEGIDITTLDPKLYICLCKLKDYEDLGLNPDEVENLQYERDDLLEELQDRGNKDV